MGKVEQLALELLEYKVADLRAQKPLRGGAASAWELYKLLVQELAQLSPQERKRFEEVASGLRSLGDAPRPGTRKAESFEELTIDGVEVEPPAEDGRVLAVAAQPGPHLKTDPAVREEQAVLQRLAHRVWWEDLEDFIRRLAAGWRAEKDRFTARLVYATLRNLHHYAQEKGFEKDVNLTRFRVVEPIPERDDALVSLNDLDSLREIIRDVIDMVTRLKKDGGPFSPLDLKEREALDYVLRAALEVAKDPYAGRLSLIPPSGPSRKQLRLAIQELAKERLPDGQRKAQRAELEQRLAQVQANERHQRQLFQNDVLRFTELVNAFFDRLAGHLPATVGGQASGPQLPGGVLFAANPALRLEAVPSSSNAVTVRLKGPIRLTLGGFGIGIMGTAPALTVYVDGQEFAIAPKLSVDLGLHRLQLFHEGDYVHLRLRERSRSLAVLVTEAMAVFFVLGSPQREDIMTVLKVAANTVLGEPQELVARAIERVAAMSAKAPDRRQAIEGFIRGAARAAKISLVDQQVQGLVHRFHAAMTATQEELVGILERIENAETAVYPFSGEPLALDLAGHRLTVRAYRGRNDEAADSLVVMTPGQVIGSFTQYLLEPLGGGTLICVGGEQQLAAIFIHGTPIELAKTI